MLNLFWFIQKGWPIIYCKNLVSPTQQKDTPPSKYYNILSSQRVSVIRYHWRWTRNSWSLNSKKLYLWYSFTHFASKDHHSFLSFCLEIEGYVLSFLSQEKVRNIPTRTCIIISWIAIEFIRNYKLSSEC